MSKDDNNGNGNDAGDVDNKAVLAALVILGNYVQAATGVSGTTAISGSTGVSSTSGGAASDVQNKVDVDVPELMDSLNGAALQQATLLQASLNTIAVQAASTNQVMNGLIQQMGVDHRDQNHTLQIRSTVAHAAVAAEIVEDTATDE